MHSPRLVSKQETDRPNYLSHRLGGKIWIYAFFFTTMRAKSAKQNRQGSTHAHFLDTHYYHPSVAFFCYNDLIQNCVWIICHPYILKKVLYTRSEISNFYLNIVGKHSWVFQSIHWIPLYAIFTCSFLTCILTVEYMPPDKNYFSGIFSVKSYLWVPFEFWSERGRHPRQRGLLERANVHCDR